MVRHFRILTFITAITAVFALSSFALAYNQVKVEIPQAGPDNNSISGTVTDGGTGFPDVTVNLYRKYMGFWNVAQSSDGYSRWPDGETDHADAPWNWTRVAAWMCEDHGLLTYVRVSLANTPSRIENGYYYYNFRGIEFRLQHIGESVDKTCQINDWYDTAGTAVSYSEYLNNVELIWTDFADNLSPYPGNLCGYTPVDSFGQLYGCDVYGAWILDVRQSHSVPHANSDEDWRGVKLHIEYDPLYSSTTTDESGVYSFAQGIVDGGIYRVAPVKEGYAFSPTEVPRIDYPYNISVTQPWPLPDKHFSWLITECNFTTSDRPHLDFSRQPTRTRVNANISPEVGVQLVDADGAKVEQGNKPVQVALFDSSGNPAAMSGHTVRNTWDTGLAEFNDLSIATPGSYELRATAAHVDGPAISVPFEIFVNDVPTANAGPDISCYSTNTSGATVTLDGSRSFDTDGDHLYYTWREGGPRGTIIAGRSTSPTAQVQLCIGQHIIELIVDDGRGASNIDTVTVKVVDRTESVGISGRVIQGNHSDYIGVPLPSVVVTARRQDGLMYQAVSNANGFYYMHNVAVGTYTVTADKLWVTFEPGGHEPPHVVSYNGAYARYGVDFRSVAMVMGQPTIKVELPNGGEMWDVGETETICWTAIDIHSDLTVELSRDGGATYETLFAGTAGDGQGDWVVSGPPTQHARIRVSGTGTNEWENPVSVSDVSDADFVIRDNVPSTITAPQDVTAEATGMDGTAVDLGIPQVNDNCDPNPGVTNDAPDLFQLGVTTVTWTVTDASDNVATATQTVTVVDTTAPELTAPADVTVEQASADGTAVELGTPQVSDICDAAPVVTNDAPAVFPLGTTEVTWTATDDSGNQTTATQQVTVEDTTPPEIVNLWVTKPSIWPPNKIMVSINVLAEVRDICDIAPVCRITRIRCDEKIGPNDAIITGAMTVSLRADRNGNGSGRTYTIEVQCTDASGNSSVDTVDVFIPHHQGNGKK